ASSSTFDDTWEYNYDDVGNPITSVSSGTVALSAGTASITTSNPYRYGIEGIWRNQSSYAYQVERKQTTPKTDISVDGTYNNFVLFNWQTDNTVADHATVYNNKWSFVNEVTRYSPYGYELENRDALDLYKSALYGYNNSVVTAVAANASYHEVAYDGFEDYSGTYSTNGHGHLDLSYSGGSVTLSDDQAHTGNYSIPVASGQTLTHASAFTINSGNIDSKANQYFSVSTINNPYEKYTVSAWFYKGTGGGTPVISATVAGATVTPVSTTYSPKIDGWQKADFTFSFSGTPSGGMTVTLGMGSDACYIDDIRIQPFRSAITTYVYDPVTLWLLAELDNRNFATFYNYDEEGTLVQVKKETEKGVSTIKTTRANIKIAP
ncbi:MAG: hypothetical protein IAF38_13370, partial [Bacteroidia bacterium]|nr:hypothetical protein [Bacteroidia bacterium]